MCVTMPNFVQIAQAVPRYNRSFDFQDGGCPPSWIFNSLKFQLLIPFGGPMCVIMSNFMWIGQNIAEIWPFFDFSRWRCSNSTSGCRSVAGILFHTFGPATEKLLSPNRVLVRGTVRALASAERRQRRPDSAISWQSSARYDCTGFEAQRLKDNNGQFEDDPLLYWQPV